MYIIIWICESINDISTTDGEEKWSVSIAMRQQWTFKYRIFFIACVLRMHKYHIYVFSKKNGVFFAY